MTRRDVFRSIAALPFAHASKATLSPPHPKLDIASRGEWPWQRPWVHQPTFKQMLFHIDTSRFRAFEARTGAGKTTALALEAIWLARRHPARLGILAAPTFHQLANGILPTFLAMLEKERIPFEFRRSTMMATLPGGAMVQFRSMDRREQIRGSRFYWFGIDDVQEANDWLFLEYRLADAAYAPSLPNDALGRPFYNLRAWEFPALRGCATWHPVRVDPMLPGLFTARAQFFGSDDYYSIIRA